MGAWIEIYKWKWEKWTNLDVAPLVGAWIEIIYELSENLNSISRSPRGSVDWNIVKPKLVIFPLSRSPRGSVDWNGKILKELFTISGRSPRGSVDWNSHTENHLLNMLVAPLAGAWIEIDQASPQFSSDISRSPRGSVDWNIFCHRSCTPPLLSLPSWERGLKSRETLWEWVGSVVTQTIKYWIWGGLGKKYPFST